jgi:hypothetical protein
VFLSLNDEGIIEKSSLSTRLPPQLNEKESPSLDLYCSNALKRKLSNRYRKKLQEIMILLNSFLSQTHPRSASLPEIE